MKGFTLIELMVALTIIGIVFGVIITSSAAIQKSSRDAQRKSDLANIQTALEQYHADAGFYPQAITGGSPLQSGTKTYLSKIPKDPSTGVAYAYVSRKIVSGGSWDDCNDPTLCVSYCLYADLENNPPASAPISPCDTAWPGSNDYYVASP